MRRVAIIAGVIALAGACALGLRGTGTFHKLSSMVGLGHKPPAVEQPKPPSQQVPSIPLTPSTDAGTGIDPTAPIVIPLELPNGGLDPKTVSDESVGIFRFDTRQRVPAKVTFTSDSLVITPTPGLEANHNYRLEILPGIRDVSGAKLKQHTRSFFTSAQPPAGVSFERIEQPAAKGEGFTCLTFGPDGKLYAAAHDGKLMRFAVADDGTLSNPETFTTIQKAENGPRLFTGFTFDPHCTADAPVIYLTHSAFGFEGAADWSAKVSRLSGPNFEKLEDLVINLPRSARDHTTNQPHFGPDGALYIPQPSNTAVGGADAYWMMRDEHGLNATILRLDTNALTPGKPIDARTPDGGGTFDPNAAGSPLTIYATGLRMPYDLLWHSNGNLYTGVNGASSRGVTPGGVDANGSSVPGIANVSLAEHDWFFKIEKGHYYGHPNPIQKHFVLNGGNPTKAPDFNEVSDYPVGTQPDPAWTPAIFDFGMHVSADGLLEYKSTRFGSALRGDVMICRYNVGSDILCLGLDASGGVSSAFSLPMTPATPKLVGPLDIVEDPRNGNLYVAEYHERQPAETRITLLRAVQPH